MIWNLAAEARKHRAYPELWVGLALAMGFLLLRTVLSGNGGSMWPSIQQDIWKYGGMTAAFAVCVTLPRVFCCEAERKTVPLLRTTTHGPFYAWLGKVLYLILVCGVIAAVIGVFSLGTDGMRIGWEGTLEPVSQSLLCQEGDLPPMSNLAFCFLQYVFLWGACVYFALFLSILALLTGRTPLTVVLSGLCYGIPLVYVVAVNRIPGALRGFFGSLLQYGFTGYLQGMSWLGKRELHGPYGWSMVPVSAAIWAGIVGVEAWILWLLWKRRAKR